MPVQRAILEYQLFISQYPSGKNNEKNAVGTLTPSPYLPIAIALLWLIVASPPVKRTKAWPILSELQFVTVLGATPDALPCKRGPSMSGLILQLSSAGTDCCYIDRR